MTTFDYGEAFSRNLGWLTPREQEALRDKRVAIAGLGGAGGVHLVTLARLGVGRFSLADLDVFELANFNRQTGAFVSTLGRSKVSVMEQLARDINPHADVRAFHDGVNADNLGAFLEGVDVYVDGLDYFVFETRRTLFDACRKRGIPVITAAPLGLGASVLCFLPKGPSFEEYFRLENAPRDEWNVRFLVGLAPAVLHRSYLVFPEIVDFANRRVPSTGVGCQMCAAMAAAEALKLLLDRGKVYGVPYSLQFDPYMGRLRRCWRPGGNRNPLQRAAIAYVKWRLRRGLPSLPSPSARGSRSGAGG